MERTAFSFEPLEKLLAEPNAREMILDWYEELSPMKRVAPLDPNWGGMIEADRAGIMCTWAARSGPTLAGFITFHLLYHLNYRRVLFAMDCGHFLAPAFRDKGRIGYRMWKTAEPALRARGVQVVMAHDSMIRSLMPFFLALGYEPRATMFWKNLGDEDAGGS